MLARRPSRSASHPRQAPIPPGPRPRPRLATGRSAVVTEVAASAFDAPHPVEPVVGLTACHRAAALRSRIGLATSSDRVRGRERATLTASRLGAGAWVERPVSVSRRWSDVGSVVVRGTRRDRSSAPLVLPAGPASMVGARHPPAFQLPGWRAHPVSADKGCECLEFTRTVLGHLISVLSGTMEGGRRPTRRRRCPNLSWTASGVLTLTCAWSRAACSDLPGLAEPRRRARRRTVTQAARGRQAGRGEELEAKGVGLDRQRRARA